jgi:hypothetical protein
MIAAQQAMSCCVGIRAFDRPRYFSEVLIEPNVVLSVVPRPFTAAMMASEMPAAINAYSIAVAPVSSRQNLEKKSVIALALLRLEKSGCVPAHGATIASKI